MEPIDADTERIIKDIMSGPLNFVKYCKYNGKPLILRPQAQELILHQTSHPRTVTQFPRGGMKSFTVSIHALNDFYTKPGYKIAFVSLSHRQSKKLLADAKRIIDESPLLAASKEHFLVDQVQKIESHTHSQIVALPYDVKTILSEHPNEIFIDEIQRFIDAEIFWESIFPMLSGASTFDHQPEIHLIGVGGFQQGVLWDVLSDAQALGFSCLKKTWLECEGYDPVDMEVRRRKMGEASYRTQYLCEMIPTSNASIPWETLANNFVESPIYNSQLPCVAGLDLAKKRDKAALLILQKDGSKFNCVALDVCQLDYSVLAHKLSVYVNEFKISSILVDVTNENSFIDFATKPPYNLPLKDFSFGGSNDKRGSLFDAMKVHLEYKRVGIPNTLGFTELIDGLKVVDLEKHLPDAVVALMLALWNAKDLKQNSQVTALHAFVMKRQDEGFLTRDGVKKVKCEEGWGKDD